MSDERADNATGATRRGLLVGAGAAGAAAVLTACGTDAEDPYAAGGEVPDAGPAPSSSSTPAASAPASAPPASAPPEGNDGGDGNNGNGEPLAAAGDIEVGGGLVLDDQNLVITQPAAGDWRGFTATCTHQGCIVAGVADGTINCGCHGSQFAIEDGSVVSGPAGSPLAAKEVTSDGENIYLA